jgi:hypothetical protein
LTDRSKSQRKRRLQLNAEDFAPPPDLYEASAEPRLDETWVQYYGGEKDGGLKRLLPEDEEAAAGQTQESDADGGHPASLGADHIKPEEEAPRAEAAAPPEVQAPELVSPTPPERPSRPVVSSLEDFRRHEPAKGAAAQAPTPPDTPEAAPEPVKRRRTTVGEDKRAAATAAAPPSPAPQAEATDAPSFEEWSRRWSPWLKRGGSIKVCEAFFELTHARGSAECFTSNSAIMELTGLSRAQCIRNIHYLIEMGFLDELSEVNNREAKGTYYRFNLIPRSLVTA